MKTYMMDKDTTGGRGRVEGEGTTNGGLTTEQTAGLETIADEGEDSANRATDRIESNTLGGTADAGAGPAIGDGQPTDTDE